MGDFNKVILCGFIGADPKPAVTVGKNEVTNLSLATSFGKGRDKITEWHRLALWNEKSDLAQKHLHVGDRILVEGRLAYSKDKEDVTWVTIQVANMVFMGGGEKKKDDDTGSDTGKRKSFRERQQEKGSSRESGENDEIPF